MISLLRAWDVPLALLVETRDGPAARRPGRVAGGASERL
jgi:hypothetical protein